MGSFRYIIVIVFSLCSLVTVTALTPEQRRLIDHLVEIYMGDNHTPGLGLSIVEGAGNVTLSIGYGQSRIETNMPATSHTLFAIGSVTKSFAGVLTVKVLHEKFPQLGESVLDTPIVRLAPGFNFTLSDRFRSESASFRDLLSHRTCLFNIGMDILLGMNSVEDYIYRTRYLRESCPFRAGFEYSNNLYALAGQLVAHIAGVTFQELSRDFFVQLGMTNSRLIDELGAHESLPTMSHAYFHRDNQTQRFNRTNLRRLHVVGGAGAILSTANDMTQYLKFHLNKGRVGAVQVVPEEVYAWLHKSANPVGEAGNAPLGSTGLYGYGLGLQLSVYKGKPWIQHHGFWAPYESRMGLFPQQQVGIFITANGPGKSGTWPGQISQLLLESMIFDIIQGNRTNFDNIGTVGAAPAPRPTANDSPASPTPVTGGPRGGPNRTRIDPTDIVGRYGSPADGDVEVRFDGQHLEINFGSRGLGTLVRQSDSETVFDVQWISDVDDDFYSSGNMGPIPKFEVEFGLQNQFEFRIKPGGFVYGVFAKDRLLDSLPSVPWAPGSCGTVRLG